MPYRKPPVVLVVVEMRFPSEGSAAQPSVADQRELRARLAGLDGDSWIVDQLNPQATLPFGSGALLPPPFGASKPLPRLMNRSKTTSATFTPTSVILETTAYGSWEEFRSVLEVLIFFVEERLQPDAYSRLGLRYLDEIHVPKETSDGIDWSTYLTSTLPPVAPTGFRPSNWQSVAQYSADGDRGIILRYGPMANGFTPSPTGLQRRTPAEGPLFVMDTDAYVQPGTIPTFEAEPILDALDSLHGPVSELFESLVKQELRQLWK